MRKVLIALTATLVSVALFAGDASARGGGGGGGGMHGGFAQRGIVVGDFGHGLFRRGPVLNDSDAYNPYFGNGYNDPYYAYDYPYHVYGTRPRVVHHHVAKRPHQPSIAAAPSQSRHVVAPAHARTIERGVQDDATVAIPSWPRATGSFPSMRFF